MGRRIFVLAKALDPEFASVPAKHRVFGTIKLPNDEPGHAFGQWSAVFERWDVTGLRGGLLAELTVMSDDAPIESLESGTQVEFFRAPSRLAMLEVLAVSETSQVRDIDTALLPGSPAREPLSREEAA